MSSNYLLNKVKIYQKTDKNSCLYTTPDFRLIVVQPYVSHSGYCWWSISASDCNMWSGNLTRPNCALNKMLLICNFANCFSLIPRMSFSSLATCRPNISSASISSDGPLAEADPLPVKFALGLCTCFNLLAARFTGKLLVCFRETTLEESVNDSDISGVLMTMSAAESFCASESSPCIWKTIIIKVKMGHIFCHSNWVLN